VNAHTFRRFLPGMALTLVIASVAFAQTEAGEKHDAERPKLEDTPKLSVRGEAELKKPADELRMSMGVVNEAPEATTALGENSTRMRDVIAAIEKIGLTENEYETGRFRIRPVYSRRPPRVEPGWQPKIVGFEVTNTVTIRTRKLELAGPLIEAGNKAGANSVEVRGFGLADPRRYRGEAIAEATKNAITDARALAEAASLRLVRIVAINLDHTPVRAQEMTFAAQGRAAMADSAAPPISPGDVTVRAGVTIVYEIAPAQ